MSFAPSDFEGLDPVVTCRWWDPIVEAAGWPVSHPYVERFWLPILGPSSLVMLRRLDQDLRDAQRPVTYQATDLAAELGMPGRADRGGGPPLARTLARLARYGALRPHDGAIAVRACLAPLTAHQLQRLTAPARRAHDLMVESREVA